ncbi:MAG: hypothetical protein R3A10_18255 [Caldilineaceae bacterium]
MTALFSLATVNDLAGAGRHRLGPDARLHHAGDGSAARGGLPLRPGPTPRACRFTPFFGGVDNDPLSVLAATGRLPAPMAVLLGWTNWPTRPAGRKRVSGLSTVGVDTRGVQRRRCQCRARSCSCAHTGVTYLRAPRATCRWMYAPRLRFTLPSAAISSWKWPSCARHACFGRKVAALEVTKRPRPCTSMPPPHTQQDDAGPLRQHAAHHHRSLRRGHGGVDSLGGRFRDAHPPGPTIPAAALRNTQLILQDEANLTRAHRPGRRLLDRGNAHGPTGRRGVVRLRAAAAC